MNNTRFRADDGASHPSPTALRPCPHCHDLLIALKAMVDRWEPDTAGTDRVMWEEACEAINRAEGL
jgi:hypothetical protein